MKLLTKKDPEFEDGYKPIPAVVIETLDGEMLIGGIQVVDTFVNRIPANSMVYLKCLSSKSGDMKSFDIRILEDEE